jgi:hypothetical protein
MSLYEDAEAELPDACIVVDVLGPNGQVNHGTIVSSFVHSIKDLEYDGPRGHLVREIARSGLGSHDVDDLDDAEDVDDESEDADPNQAPVKFHFFEDDSVLLYWLTGDDLVDDEDQAIDCVSLYEDAEAELPDACVVVDVLGPNGQVNHGTIVSSFVHSIKDLEYDGPRGHLVRELAWSGYGQHQADDLDDATDVDDESEDADEDRPKKEKKEKREGHPGRGNGRR